MPIASNIAAETCGECKKTTKTTYKTSKKQCTTDYRAGTNGITTKQLFLACKYTASSDRYEALALCYDLAAPCNPTDAPTSAPTSTSAPIESVLGEPNDQITEW